MNASHVPWLQLPGQQNILVQALFTETDYSVRVTDLSNVWSETLGRRQIKARAEELDCPIDADANLPDLLERLQNALTVDSKTTEIVLYRRGDQLRLTTTETLGRVKLEWKFRLTALPYSAVACGLTLSLFSMVSYYQRCVQTLLEVISDKDTLIRQMNDFLKTSNLTFKPNRRQGAFRKFDRLEWLDRCRDKAAREAMDSQEVIDALSLVGRDADFRKDWKSVLTKAGDWQVSFLPDTIEQTPSKVTSSLKKKKRSRTKTRFEEIATGTEVPLLRKEDTNAQAAEFQSPKSKQVVAKKKIHTKWSSPVPSYASSEEDSSEDDASDDKDDRDDRDEESQSPTPRREESKHMLTNDRKRSESPVEVYKVRDNRESQELESDIDLYNQTPTKSRIRQSPLLSDGSDDTQDESDEELTLKSNTQTSGPQITSSPPQTPKKGQIEPSKSRTASITSSPGVKNLIGGTPQKRQPSHVKNLISPRKSQSQASGAASPAELEHKSSTADSQVIDLEAEKKALAMKRRAEAQRIENSPSKSKMKRARRF